jgi:hypothetical protein
MQNEGRSMRREAPKAMRWRGWQLAGGGLDAHDPPERGAAQSTNFRLALD